MYGSSGKNTPAPPPGSPACFVPSPSTPPSSSGRLSAAAAAQRDPSYAPIHRILNLYPVYSPMSRGTSHQDWQNLQQASWTTNRVMQGAVHGNLHAAICRWVCGATEDWIPCWSCQLKICDDCTKFKTIRRPPRPIIHGCEPRCVGCFDDFCRGNYTVNRRCRCTDQDRANRPDDEAYILEDRPKAVCGTCARKSSAELLRLRRRYEIEMGYIDQSKEEQEQTSDGVDGRTVRCVECDCGMEQGNRMYWSCDRCSGRCGDKCHEPMRMKDRGPRY